MRFGASHAIHWLQKRAVEERFGPQLRAADERRQRENSERAWDAWMRLKEYVARDREVFLGRMTSEIARVDRSMILPMAERLIAWTAGSKAMLEV